MTTCRHQLDRVAGVITEPSNGQELVAGFEPGQPVVTNALGLQNAVEQ